MVHIDQLFQKTIYLCLFVSILIPATLNYFAYLQLHAFLYAVFSLGTLCFPASLSTSYLASRLNAIFYEAILVY